jgi:hypothetical protein
MAVNHLLGSPAWSCRPAPVVRGALIRPIAAAGTSSVASSPSVVRGRIAEVDGAVHDGPDGWQRCLV